MAIYMKIDGIDGQVTTQGFDKWIELLSTSIGIHRHTTTGAGGKAREGAHPEIQEIHVSKHFDKATPKILQDAVAGTFEKKVDIKWTTTTKQKVETYFHVELKDAGITSYQQSSGPDGVPMESLTLNFAKITFSPSPLDVKGQPQKGDVVNYDLMKMEAS
jgi:type VI secretion system secreted protein Hcp